MDNVLPFTFEHVSELWWPVLFALAYSFLMAAVSVASFPNAPLDSEARPARPRGHEGIFALTFLLSAGSVFALMNGFRSLDDIGVTKMTMAPVAAGAVTFGLFVGLITSINALTGRRDEACHKTFLVMRALWPANKTKKCLTFTALCLVNPVLTETIYRGFLAIALTRLTDSLLLSVGLSIVLSISSEIGQGKSQCLVATGSTVVTTALVLSPFGLIAAITFTMLRNVLAIVTLRKNMLCWKASRAHQV